LLETPIDNPGDDRRNVATLWELAGLKEQAPTAEKGFSMLTPALKRKMNARAPRRAASKKSSVTKTKRSVQLRKSGKKRR
jgi:hypothetical protein